MSDAIKLKFHILNFILTSDAINSNLTLRKQFSPGFLIVRTSVDRNLTFKGSAVGFVNHLADHFQLRNQFICKYSIQFLNNERAMVNSDSKPYSKICNTLFD